MKTSELTGAALDWAVGTALKLPDPYWNGVRCAAYSTDWSQGGPIIERERIDLSANLDYWEARLWAGREVLDKLPRDVAAATLRARRITNSISKVGPTPLIAAMRCFVASRLGDEVDIPEELAGV
jgi:hypothetical protein